MGYQKPNLADAFQQVNKANLEMNSSYNDGFTSWHVKQDLYQLYFHLQRTLKNAPEFGEIENEWLDQHYKDEFWNQLKK